MNPDGTPIINETIVVDANTVKFVLNMPRGAFFNILPFCGSSILSPDSTPANDYLALYQDLIGTGPFMFDSFTAGVEIKLSAFYVEGHGDTYIEYWQGRPVLDTITFVVISTLDVMNQALLSGDIDILTAMDPAFLDQHDADPDITLHYAGGTLSTTWITMNVNEMNVGMREATAYALNYSYVIDTIYERTAVRWPTFIPMGITYANYTLDYPTFDRTHARAVLLADPVYGARCTTAGLTASSTDQDWRDVAASATPLDTFNITWNFGNDLRGEVADRLDYDMSFVGVNIGVYSRAWADLLPFITFRSAELDMYTLGWGPDYLDPENYITPIWSNTTLLNGGDYNAPDVQQLMKDGITEVDLVARKAIYDEIQQKMVERDYPGIPLLTNLNYDAWKNEVVGFPSNAINNIWFYDVYLA
jgi:peptide/nickel transport system substrate-binding protein